MPASEDYHLRRSHRGGQMSASGVGADQQTAAPQERGHLSKGGLSGEVVAEPQVLLLEFSSALLFFRSAEKEQGEICVRPQRLEKAVIQFAVPLRAKEKSQRALQ